MKRFFVFAGENSNKFWDIEIKDKSYTVNFGKMPDRNEFSEKSGKLTEKTFEDEESCKKAAEKIINQKLKKGYVELDKLFFTLYEGTRFQTTMNPERHGYLEKALKQIDKLERPYKIPYASAGIVVNTKYLLADFNDRETYAKEYDDIKEFILRVPKLEWSEARYADIIYSVGIKIANEKKDEEFKKFCEEHSSKK
jgi:predicted DNA-binding WGR domain protein